jgi:NAD-dependent deacetylase
MTTVDLLAAAHAAVVLTGAGISTESGIPDFRGPDGLWQDPAMARLAHVETFRHEPGAVWEFYARRFAGVAGAEPNAGHHAIAALARRGVVGGLITQNIDGLHRRAGSEPIEVHGSLALARCTACGAEVAMPDALALREQAPDGVPRCACGGVLKPGVVMFGELLPEDAIEAAMTAVEGCDLLIAVGSSLAVHPVAGLVDVAKGSGAAVAILNREPTPYDRVADVVDRRPLGESLPELQRRFA